MSTQDSRLLSYIQRLELFEQAKKEIVADIRDVKTEAKSAGFDLKIIARIMAERRMTPEERRTERAMLEIYRGATGLLDGTPLGDAARDRMMAEDPNTPPPAEDPSPESARTVAEARAEGAEAFRAAGRIIDNPYTAGDPRRAAWDEGFCAASGSDGMDIPEAWRRKPKKDAKEEAKGEAKAAAGDEADATDPDQEGLPFDARAPEDGADGAADEDAAEEGAAQEDAAEDGDEEDPFESDEPFIPEPGSFHGEEGTLYRPPADAQEPATLAAAVKRTRRKPAGTKAKPAKAPKAAKPEKPAAPRGKRRPAGGEARP